MMEQAQHSTFEVLMVRAAPTGMIVQIKQGILLLWMLCFAGQGVLSQDHKTKNNYTGAWDTLASWNPTWPAPQTNVNSLDITINGYITVKTSLSLSGSTSKLIVEDTLVINGDLIINDNNDVQINNNGILIVRGNIIISDKSNIAADGYFITTGDITKLGSTNNGSFKSNDDPIKVFVGGTITPTSITNNKPDFFALDCTSPQTNTYLHSDCSHGDMTDIISDPIYPFFQSTCVTATLMSSYANNTFCAGTSVTYTASGGTNYNFRVNGTSAQIDGSTTYTTTTLTNGSIVDVIVTSTAGCKISSSAITNTVIALPVATVNSNSPVCVGNPLTLTGGSAGMTTYAWTGPNGFTANTQNAVVSPASTLAMAGIYSLTVTNASGCTSNAATITVVVNALPLATANSNSSVCVGNPLTLTGGSAEMATYSWTGPNGFTANTQNAVASPASTLAMAGIYRLTVTNASGCISNAATITVVVNALPLATVNSNSPVCVGNPLTLTGGSAGMATYSWTGPNGFTANTPRLTVSPIATKDMAGIYNLKVTDANGCIETLTQSLMVNETPVAIAGQDQVLSFVFETEMKAELSSSETGEWSLISGFGHVSDMHSPTSLVTELTSGDNIFLWKLQNSSCEASAEVKITVNDLFVPSVITPNGDGRNDYFKLNEYNGQVALIVFNRWGNQEYTSNDYRNDWDGRNNKGSELPGDTYFYILNFEDGNIIKGSVLIKK